MYVYRCASFSVCDALVMASVRHGLSLVPFELESDHSSVDYVLPGVTRHRPSLDDQADLEAARAVFQDRVY